MELRRLGRTDLHVSVVGLGCNNFGGKADLAATRSIIDQALACGINFLDTSDSYGPSEDFIGEVLAERRKQVEQNARAAGWALTSAELAEIDRLTLAPEAAM